MYEGRSSESYEKELSSMDEHLAFLQSQAAYVESEVFNIRYADIQYPASRPRRNRRESIRGSDHVLLA